MPGLSNGDGTFTKAAQGQNFLGFPYGSPQSTFPIIGADFNQDGRTDLAFFNSSTDRWYMFALSNGDGSFRKIAFAQNLLGFPYGAPQATAGIRPIDSNGDGRPELFFVNSSNDGWYLLAQVYNEAPPDLVASISNGAGSTVGITYKSLNDGGVYSKDSGAAYPVQDVQSPLYVVSSASADNGIGGGVTTSYFYTGAKTNLLGGGFLGFRKLEVTSMQTGIKVTTTFRQDYPFEGLPLQVVKAQSSGAVLDQVTNTWTDNPAYNALGYDYGTGKYHRCDLTSSVEMRRDVSGATLPTVTTTTAYDAYGNATSVMVSTDDGYSKVTNNLFTNDLTNWLLGRLVRSTVTSTTP